MPESVNLTKQFFKSPERKLASAAFAPIGLGAGIVSKPIRNVFGSVWSDDKHGNPGWLKKKIRERGTFVGALLTGGTHTAIDASGRKTIPGARFIVPKRLTSSRIWRGKPRGGPGSAPPPAAGGPTPSTGTPPVTGGGAAAAPAAGATATPVVTHPAASSVPPATSGGPVSVGPSPKDITDETTRRVEAKFGSWASAPSDQINKIREEVTKDLTKDDTSEA